MKQILIAIVVLFVASAAMAQTPVSQTHPTETIFGVSYSDTKDAKIANVKVDLAFPMTEHLYVGPSFDVSYVKPDGASSVDVWSLGGLAYLRLHDGTNGPVVGAKAQYNVQDANGYLVTPFVGLQFGTDKSFVQVDASHPFHFDKGLHNHVDLESTQLTAAIGLRF